MSIKLTQYSHGAGCGCKLSPAVLHDILKDTLTMPDDKNLLVGNHTKDDAAVYDLGGGQALISTTDFFMPIVDDAFDFGRIASANAISDVYAMGGRPIMAIAILGWPINVLPIELASSVIAGSKAICAEAGITLAGGHSIDAPEPIFGLAVNGLVSIANMKTNAMARVGDYIYLTKALGVGILTTAQKKGLLQETHSLLAPQSMIQLNKVGSLVSKYEDVHAITDVTGFGLLGHLSEVCEASNVSAKIEYDRVPILDQSLYTYLDQGCIPGGTHRNWKSYEDKIKILPNTPHNISLLADPQTSGGLLMTIAKEAAEDIIAKVKSDMPHLAISRIGKIVEKEDRNIIVE